MSTDAFRRNSFGALSCGYADLNTGGTPSGELTGATGALAATIDPNTGRATGSYTISTASGNLIFDFAFYGLNACDFVLLSTDSPITVGSAALLCGRALSSSPTFAPEPLNGYYLLAAQGQVNGNTFRNLAEIATLSATAAGTIPTATLYVNDAGTDSRREPITSHRSRLPSDCRRSSLRRNWCRSRCQ